MKFISLKKNLTVFHRILNFIGMFILFICFMFAYFDAFTINYSSYFCFHKAPLQIGISFLSLVQSTHQTSDMYK